MPFTEEWFPARSCVSLKRLLGLTQGLEGRVVEVGCWEGRSTLHLAHGAFPDVVHAVDTWQGSKGEISAELAQERDVYATFLANMAEFTRGNVVAHRMDWRDYFQDRSPVRFIHIDGEHSYEAVRANIETVKPLIVPGGVICGDDAHHIPILEALCDTLGPSVDFEATLWWWMNGTD